MLLYEPSNSDLPHSFCRPLFQESKQSTSYNQNFRSNSSTITWVNDRKGTQRRQPSWFIWKNDSWIRKDQGIERSVCTKENCLSESNVWKISSACGRGKIILIHAQRPNYTKSCSICYKIEKNSWVWSSYGKRCKYDNTVLRLRTIYWPRTKLEAFLVNFIKNLLWI